MTDILDLDGWTVLAKTTEGGIDILTAEYRPEPKACQKCGVIGRLYKHGTKLVSYLDAPNRGLPSKLRASVKRYICRDCGGSFMQPLGGVRSDRRMTERCLTYIHSICLRDTFVRVAEHVGCDDWTIRSVAEDYIASLQAAYKPALPVWLGIDETQIFGEMRLVLTDVGHRRPIEMLPARDKGSLATWLNHFRDRSIVRGVATDMWAGYRTVVKQLLPGVPVVVDKFHIVRMATYGMESVRVRLQKVRKRTERRDWLRSKAVLTKRPANLSEKQRFNRDMWLDNEPELAEAYRLKEAFYGIYDLDKADAIAAFDGFAATVPAHLKRDFKELLSAMKNWRTEILAFFDHPITNAYTEALNGVAKTINRQGRGYSYDVLRARLLFGRKAKPVEEPWHLKVAMAADEAQLKVFRHEMGDRCLACGLNYGRAQWARPHMAVLVRGAEQRRVLLCSGCFDRFHTEAKERKALRSTR